MDPGPQRDYLLEAVGLAYRHLKLPGEALTIYRRGLAQSPQNEDLAAGEIRSLADLGFTLDAIQAAQANLTRWGERLEVLLAAGYAATVQGKPVEALRYLDRALLVDPASREAVHDRLLAIALMGAPQVSLALDDASPGALSDDERRKLEGDAVAALVRWGVFEPTSEAERFAATDRALAVLDGLILRWSAQGSEAHQAILRARFDRMVALRDRVRMAEVIAEYEDLVKLAVPIPGYALVAAADASLYLRKPEQARDLYLRGLAVDPRNPETRLALFYAYVDLDDLYAAYRQIDAALADQAVWLRMKGLNDPLENPDHAAAELAAAEARLYADDLAEAHRRIARLTEAAPNNTRYLSALANV
jgi:biofilm PGA synthesis protein PgaA